MRNGLGDRPGSLLGAVSFAPVFAFLAQTFEGRRAEKIERYKETSRGSSERERERERNNIMRWM